MSSMRRFIGRTFFVRIMPPPPPKSGDRAGFSHYLAKAAFFFDLFRCGNPRRSLAFMDVKLSR
jgi:hypothetical protein